MLNRVMLALTLALLGALWYVGHLYLSQRDGLTTKTATLEGLTEAQNQAQERSKSDRQVLVARQARIASEARKLAQENEGLRAALQRNKSWSDTDVPPEVQDALLGRSDGLGGPSEPAGLRE